jgi:hypothetical protein
MQIVDDGTHARGFQAMVAMRDGTPPELPADAVGRQGLPQHQPLTVGLF